MRLDALRVGLGAAELKLHMRLKHVRTQRAAAAHVPPNNVLSDAAIFQMVRDKPTSVAAMRLVEGIPAAVTDTHGTGFRALGFRVLGLRDFRLLCCRLSDFRV